MALTRGARRRVGAGVAAALASAAVGAWLVLWNPWRYYPAAELDRVAMPLADIGLEFPKEREGIDYFGTLRMDLCIDAAGHVDEVRIVESTVPLQFQRSAVAAFSKARFEPARRMGRAVKSVKRVEVRFEAPLRELNRGS
jgi:TonB family protein